MVSKSQTWAQISKSGLVFPTKFCFLLSLVIWCITGAKWASKLWLFNFLKKNCMTLVGSQKDIRIIYDLVRLPRFIIDFVGWPTFIYDLEQLPRFYHDFVRLQRSIMTLYDYHDSYMSLYDNRGFTYNFLYDYRVF